MASQSPRVAAASEPWVQGHGPGQGQGQQARDQAHQGEQAHQAQVLAQHHLDHRHRGGPQQIGATLVALPGEHAGRQQWGAQ